MNTKDISIEELLEECRQEQKAMMAKNKLKFKLVVQPINVVFEKHQIIDITLFWRIINLLLNEQLPPKTAPTNESFTRIHAPRGRWYQEGMYA